MGVADQLGLVEHLVDELHHLAPDLDPDADVDGAGLVGDAVFGADPFQPVGPPPPGGDDRLPRPAFGGLIPLPEGSAGTAAVFDQQVLARPAEQQLDPLLPQMVLNREVEVLGFLGAKMADRAVDQLQAGLDRPLADLLDLIGGAHPFDMGVGPEFEVDLVGIVNQLLGKVRADQVRQVAAHLVGEGKLAVGEGSGPRKAGGDVAVGLAVHAAAGLVLRAMAFLDRLPLFDDGNPLPASLPEEFQGGKDAGRAGADDEQVCAHKKSSFPQKSRCGTVQEPFGLNLRSGRYSFLVQIQVYPFLPPVSRRRPCLNRKFTKVNSPSRPPSLLRCRRVRPASPASGAARGRRCSPASSAGCSSPQPR